MEGKKTFLEIAGSLGKSIHPFGQPLHWTQNFNQLLGMPAWMFNFKQPFEQSALMQNFGLPAWLTNLQNQNSISKMEGFALSNSFSSAQKLMQQIEEQVQRFEDETAHLRDEYKKLFNRYRSHFEKNGFVIEEDAFLFIQWLWCKHTEKEIWELEVKPSDLKEYSDEMLNELNADFPEIQPKGEPVPVKMYLLKAFGFFDLPMFSKLAEGEREGVLSVLLSVTDRAIRKDKCIINNSKPIEKPHKKALEKVSALLKAWGFEVR
jgi:hypothetical protein